MPQFKMSLLNHLECMSSEATLDATLGFFRNNGFFDYNARCDDFAFIVSKYLNEKMIKIVSNKTINAEMSVGHVASLDNRFIIATQYYSKQMLSINFHAKFETC